MSTYQYTVTVRGFDISDENVPSRKLNTMVDAQYYCAILSDHLTYIIDLSKAIVRESMVDMEMSVSAFVAARINTASKISAYASNAIPQKDAETDAYVKRITCEDGQDSDLYDLGYTSVRFTEIINDPHYYTQSGDLILKPKPGHSFQNTLVSVNGVFHRTSLFNGDLLVLGGHTNIKNAKKSHVCVYDTTSVGGHQSIPITSQIVDMAEDDDPWSSIYLKLDVDLTDKTVFLIMNGRLHALDGTYEVVGNRRVKINVCKMDLIGDFLTDPNTQYQSASGSGGIYGGSISGGTIPESGGNTDPPFSEQAVHFFTTGWPAINEQGAYGLVALIEYVYSSEFPLPPTDIAPTTPVENITSPAFVLSTLVAQRSRLIVINNNQLYRRRYVLHPMVAPDYYECRGDDTPRGIMMYHRRFAIPYKVISSQSGQHTFSIDFHIDRQETWRTAPVSTDPTKGNTTIPSPRYFDLQVKQDYAVELFEFMSA